MKKSRSGIGREACDKPYRRQSSEEGYSAKQNVVRKRKDNTMDYREALKDKKRIVIKIGSSSLTHEETGN